VVDSEGTIESCIDGLRLGSMLVAIKNIKEREVLDFIESSSDALVDDLIDDRLDWENDGNDVGCKDGSNDMVNEGVNEGSCEGSKVTTEDLESSSTS